MFSEEELQLFSKATGFKEDDIIKLQDNLQQNSYRLKRIRDLKHGESFEKQYLLGKGGQAFVFLGENILTNLEVAIKISRSDKKIYQDICNELNAIERIVNHDYIVNIFKHFMLEKELIVVLIMEKCKYSLDQEINEMKTKGQEYSQDQIKFIILSMLNALCEIHTNDIIHFDIKPSNILITQEGNYKLADFGYAKSLKIDQSHIYSYGNRTFNYNSPEQNEVGLNEDQQKQHKLQSLTDIYSMGVSLLEVIGIKMDFQIILGLKQNSFKEIDTKVKCNYNTYYSFIKYFMLQFDQEKRYSAIRLRDKFIEIYKNEFTWTIEENRINNQITSYLVKSANKNSKYLAYLYYFLSKIMSDNDSSLIQKSIQIIKDLSIDYSFDELIFLEHYSELLIKSKLYEESLNYLLQSESIIEKKYPDNRLGQALITLKLSQYWKQIGNNPQKYLDYSLKAKTLLKNYFKSIHPDIALSLNNIGESYKELGDANKALEFKLKALKMRETLYKGDHPDIADSLNNVGISYDKLGDANKALEYDLKALKMREALYKGDHPDIALSLNNIGESYYELGDANKGLEYHLKALKMRETLYKGDHPDIADSLNNVGISYDKLGDANKALEYDLKALKMREALYNGDHRDISESLNNVGVSYLKLGDANKALEYHLKALKMREALYKGDHLDIAESLNNIYSSYYYLGEANKGLEYCLKCLKMSEVLFKGDHKYIAQSLNSLGLFYGQLGDTNKGLEYKLKALNMREALYNGDHPDILKSLNSLGKSYYELGDVNKALEYQLMALKMSEALYKGDHPDNVKSFIILSILYDKSGDANKVLEYKLKALKMREALYKGDHPDIVLSLNNIGISYDKLGEANKALKYYLKALKMREALYKGEHPDIVESLNKIAFSYEKIGNNIKSQQYKQRGIEMKNKLKQ